MKKFIITLFAATSITVNALNDSIKELYRDDFNTFIRLLEETHPDPYTAFGGRIEFRREAQRMRDVAQRSADAAEFRSHLSAFTARLEDGHTFIIGPNATATNQPCTEKFFPIVFKIASDGLFIHYASNEYTRYTGDKLLALNKIPTDSLLRKISTITPTENKYGAMLALRNRIANECFAAAFLAETSPVTLTLQDTDGNIRDVDVAYNENPAWNKPQSELKTRDDNKLLYGQMLENNPDIGYFVWNAMISREAVESTPPSNPQYQRMLNYVTGLLGIEKQDDDNAAVRQIPELYPTFNALLTEMKKQQSEYLIIDLRENTGGMTPLTLPLLYMLYGDKYLNYESNAQYIQRISPLLLQKRGITADVLSEKTGNVPGDYEFRRFFQSDDGKTIEEKRKDPSFIAYRNNFAREFTGHLNGKPVYEPRVIVLCSPETFSAAYHFLYYLSEIGNATIVGVPPSQAGNAFMESTFFELPNTQTRGSISNAKQVLFPGNNEKGKIFTPDFPMAWADFAKYNFDKNAEILYCLDLIKREKIHHEIPMR